MEKNRIFKKGSTTYYYASLFFPAKIRDEVFSLYAFVRSGDDLVDKPKPSPEKLDEMIKMSKAAWEGKKSQDNIIDDLVELGKRKKFEWHWIESFLEAMKRDLVKKEYKTFGELVDYMYGSAEVVGLMMARIMELPKEAEETARLQGRAMQFVNFIRDIKEDWDLGRSYLPSEDLKKFKVKGRDYSREWGKLIRYEIERYRLMQRQAEKGYQYIPNRLLLPIKTAAKMYEWTANKIYERPKVVWERKVKPRPIRVLGEIIKNYIGI